MGRGYRMPTLAMGAAHFVVGDGARVGRATTAHHGATPLPGCPVRADPVVVQARPLIANQQSPSLPEANAASQSLGTPRPDILTRSRLIAVGGGNMRLSSVRIQNFKCIEDSGEFSLDRVTCLVGKNESGKSAILQALYKLNPVVESEGRYDDVVEYPRRRWSSYRERREREPDVVVTTKWQLEETDRRAIADVLGPNALRSDTVTLTKGYDNTLRWEIQVDERAVVAYLLDNSNLTPEEADRLRDCNTVEQLMQRLAPVQSLSERERKFLDSLRTMFPDGRAAAGAERVLGPLMPRFLYFAEYQKMKGRIALNDLVERKKRNQVDFGERIFEALLKLAGTSVEEVQKIGTLEHLYAELEGISNEITETIFNYWSQNRYLEVEFRIDMGRPQDPPPFNSGPVFQTRIRNNRHRVTVNFDERSSGFIWFFSFLVWFSQLRQHYGERLIVLLDEPGLSLHARAQQDLLRYIRERLAPHHQVVYTTHSPFMIDPENLLAVRIVEDLVDQKGTVLGTKVRDDVFAIEPDTIFPLQAALGYDITQTLFVGKNVVLVEGPSDLLYLKWFSSELRRQGREGLDHRWVITPCGGIDKVASFLALFGGSGLRVAVVTDFHHGIKYKVRDLNTARVYQLSGVLTANSYVGRDEADIEDLLGRAFYYHLVNQCYGLQGDWALVPDKQDTAGRVVKEVEDHFRTLPPDAPEFDHYAPAAYLVENGNRLRDEVPGLADALDRFERLFHDLNEILRKGDPKDVTYVGNRHAVSEG